MDYTFSPLADRLRPKSLDDYCGQQHLIAPGKVLRKLIETDHISSMIFWGPPGVGKTTLAMIIANSTNADFVNFSAVNSGIKEIRAIMKEAEERAVYDRKTILFIDEIHRFNKLQQDAFLPYVENGSIILIGATTENPSFEINNALLSRCKVFVLKALSSEDIKTLLKRAMTSPSGFGEYQITCEEKYLDAIANFSNGDARTALSTLEMILMNGDCNDNHIIVDDAIVEQCLSKKNFLFDKKGDEHYNLISALHKSMRNSDPDAAIYWLARMLEAGEDPLYIARRLIRFASEDVGIADPKALELAVAVYDSCHYLGMPECNVNLTQAVVYLSVSPKSNALYMAYEAAKKDAIEMIDEPVPLQICNAPTKLMESLDYGKGYQYAHDSEEKLTTMECLPQSLAGKEYYKPTTQGIEERYKKRLDMIKEWKRSHKE